MGWAPRLGILASSNQHQLTAQYLTKYPTEPTTTRLGKHGAALGDAAKAMKCPAPSVAQTPQGLFGAFGKVAQEASKFRADVGIRHRLVRGLRHSAPGLRQEAASLVSIRHEKGSVY